MRIRTLALGAFLALALSCTAFACDLCGFDHDEEDCPYVQPWNSGSAWNGADLYGGWNGSAYGDMGAFADPNGGYGSMYGSLFSSGETYGNGTGSFYSDFGGGSFSGAYFGNGDMYIDGWWPGK